MFQHRHPPVDPTPDYTALLMPAVDETGPFVDPFVRYQTLRAGHYAMDIL